jgi:hypothetical protein
MTTSAHQVTLHEVRLPPAIGFRSTVKQARTKLAPSPEQRHGVLIVQRANKFFFLAETDLMAAEDSRIISDLKLTAGICKVSNRKPIIHPLSTAAASWWLGWYLRRNAAKWLFIGTDTSGSVRLLTPYEDELARIPSLSPR